MGKKQVIDSNGKLIGTINNKTLNTRLPTWEQGFYSLKGDQLVLRARIAPPSERTKITPQNIVSCIDAAYKRYHKRIVEQTRDEATRGARESRRLSEIQKRNALRARERKEKGKGDRLTLAGSYLTDRSKGCQQYVRRVLLRKTDFEIEELIKDEIESHRSLYAGIQSYEHVKLIALALANAFDRTNSTNTDDLLSRAHLFYFDDEAWWEARACDAPLKHLPYPVCLVEDVLVWEAGNTIESKALSDGADEAASKRMLSFVVKHCQPLKKGDGTTAFMRTKPELPGRIEVTEIAGAIHSAHQSHHTTTSHQGRSPRTHTRRGHWRNQAYGPGMKLHRRIWISDTIVTPSGKAYRIHEASRVHVVTLS